MTPTDVGSLHALLIKLGYTIPAAETQVASMGSGTENALKSFQTSRGLAPTGVVDVGLTTALNQAVSDATYTVRGSVLSSERAGVGGLVVEIVDKNVGGDVSIVRAQTDDQGRYHATAVVLSVAQAKKTAPDLQARVSAGKTFLAASVVRYNASHDETLDVTLPSSKSSVLPSEYETLLAAVSAYAPDIEALRETGAQQDVTYLANKTGWDARAVAYLVLSTQLSKQHVDAQGVEIIAPALFYALLRAGLPADPNALFQVDAQAVGRIWKAAVDQGVIRSSLASTLSEAQAAFHKLSTTVMLNPQSIPVQGVSSLKDILTPALADSAKQAQFVDLLNQYRGDMSTFWTTVAKTFGADAASRLKVEGQLALLTSNNAPLIQRIRASIPTLAGVVDLARAGFYTADSWTKVLDASVPIPTALPGASTAERRTNYAALLAAQVRVSFPTAVVADMVRTKFFPTAAANAADGVQAFLIAHEDTFAISAEPIDQYIARNKLSTTQAPALVVQEIKRLQRVYQITPSDQVMSELLKAGLDSAYAVARQARASFVAGFADRLGGADVAALVHAKAQQVHHATVIVATQYLIQRRAPPIGSPTGLVLSPTSGLATTSGVAAADTGAPAASAGTAAIAAAPATAILENLFSSMDFCACDACRSLLSPAAYLVDLLQFLDRGGAFTLFDTRRPDVQRLLLTCENTNTAVPYIDLVLEALEYWVTQSPPSLAGYVGHDTGHVAGAELLTTPQFTSDAAYDLLEHALFPPPLPFHRPLELLRRLFRGFGANLAQALELLRENDALAGDASAPLSYGWVDILIERIGVSRDEYALFADPAPSLATLFGYPTATTDTSIIADLSHLKRLTTSLAVTYTDIVALLATSFVNPTGALSIVNPTDSSDLCSFDALELRATHADGTVAMPAAADFVRVARFVRLWKKLNWTLDQIDMAVTATAPASGLPLVTTLGKGPLAVALLRLGVVVQVMEALHLDPNTDLAGLLACFAPISTTGASSLYSQMFLQPAAAPPDVAFVLDASGNLAGAADPLQAHSETLRSAFNLSGDELSVILVALGFDATTTLAPPVSSLAPLEYVSRIYRHAWLARKLRLSVQELVLLIRFSGLDPFASPDPPTPPILQFIRFVQALQSAGLKPVQALYLMWNQDISGRSAPDDASIAQLARTLRGHFAQIESDFSIGSPPKADIARARMALVYGVDATTFFFSLIDGTLTNSVAYADPNRQLAAPIVAAAEAIAATGKGELTYDDFNQTLSYRGVLDAATRDRLKGALTPPDPRATFPAAVDALYLETQRALTSFFAQYPQPDLQSLYDAYASSGDLGALLTALLAELKAARKQEQALADLAAAATTDASLAQTIASDARVLHADGVAGSPASNDLTAIEQPGLSVELFWTPTATGVPSQTIDTQPTLAYSPSGPTTLPPNPTAGRPISGIWSGYLQAPASGTYRFIVDTDVGATVTFTLDAPQVGGTTSLGPYNLTAGMLYAITLRVDGLTTSLSVKWQTSGRGAEVIPAQSLYSSTLVSRLRATYVRYLKASSLAAKLSMSPNEIAYFASQAAYQVNGDGWLSTLLVSGSPDASTSAALRQILVTLLDFARIKATLSLDDDRLLAVLNDPSSVVPGVPPKPLLSALFGWDASSVTALLHGADVSALRDFTTLRRVFDAYALAGTMAISGAALVASTTNNPTRSTTDALQSALRARYAAADWLNVLKPINDEMRSLQRDALVAYVLQRMALDPPMQASTPPTPWTLDTADKLFEYFLMDVQMDPCMTTSRVRFALSAVQLFVDRCLMNLESGVPSGALPPDQWAWMKRYRLWEANRKVFLWPENWLDPELRDDQTPLFKQALGGLLQGDITEDSAATALLDYLSNLEILAKLDPCGLCYDESKSVAHVIARTGAGAQRQYHHRRRDDVGWTPWQKIGVDIEDTPVLPVLWRGRLMLFWLRILQTAQSNAGPQSSDTSTATGFGVVQQVAGDGASQSLIGVTAILCFSEYYNGKWQPAKTSDPASPLSLGSHQPGTFYRDGLLLQASIAGTNPDSDPLRISLNHGTDSFLLYNTHSAPVVDSVQAFGERRLAMTPTAARGGSRNPTFSLTYTNAAATEFAERDLLTSPIAGEFVQPLHPLTNAWDAPFFFFDDRHAFYVTTNRRASEIPAYDGFYIPPVAYHSVIPALVVTTSATAAVVHPRPPQGDANVRYVLGGTGQARFAGTAIGPLGSQVGNVENAT